MTQFNVQFGKMPFVRFLIFYLMGIGAGYYFVPHPTVYFLLIIASLFSFLLFFIFAIVNRFQNFLYYRYFSIAIYFFLFCLGWILMWQPNPIIQYKHFSQQKSQALIGYINDEPKITENSIRFPLKVTHSVYNNKVLKSIGNLLITIRIDESSREILSAFQYGNEFIIPSSFSIVNPPYNPNEFNYQSYLNDQLIWHQIYLSSENISQIGFNKGSNLVKQALLFRQRMVEKLNQSLNTESSVTIASALVLGYRNQLDRELLNTFSVTGTIHVLAVSGLHVGIIFTLFSMLLFWMKGKNWRLIKAVILVLLIWVYALITGLSPSVLRASIMISFGIISFSFARKGNIYNTIAASAFFLLLFNPYYITEIGFKLSYFAVLGIVLLYPSINTLIRFKNPVLAKLWSYAVLSTSAQIATFPMVLYYFHFFPVYFLPANVFIILPVSFVVYLGLLVLLIPQGMIQFWISRVLENLILFINKVLHFFEQLPYATLKGIWIEPWHYLVLYLLLFSLLIFLFSKKKKARYILIFITCFIILLSDRAIKKIGNQYVNEIRIYNVYKNMVIGLYDNGKAVIYSDSLTEKSKRFQYSIAPNLDASIKAAQFIYLMQGDSLKRENLLIRDNLIQLGSKSLLIYSDEQTFSEFISVDLLYIRNNSKLELSTIHKNIRFKKILLDASNSDWYIKRLRKEAEIMSIPIYVLKNNFAYVW